MEIDSILDALARNFPSRVVGPGGDILVQRTSLEPLVRGYTNQVLILPMATGDAVVVRLHKLESSEQPWRSRAFMELEIVVLDHLSKTEDSEELPAGVVHTDVSLSNVLWETTDLDDLLLTGLVDFDFVHLGPFLHDVGFAIPFWCISPTTHLVDDDLVATLLEFHDVDRLAFLRLPISDFVPKRPLVKLEKGATLGDLLDAFRKHNLTSIPVCTRPETGEAFAESYELFDVADAIDFLHGALEGTKTLTDELKAKLWNAPVSVVKAKTPTLLVFGRATVSEVIAAMRANQNYRMLVVGDDDELVHIVTQSGIVRFINDNLDKLHPRPDATLAELSFYGAPPPLLTCREDERAIAAFAAMRSRKFTAAPVVDSMSVMKHFISVRDARFVTCPNLQDLLLPAMSFLKKYRPTYPRHSLDETLRQLIGVFSSLGHHHAFFTDETGAPVNNVS
ncbi:hypothetical protein DFJ74DRAFT_732476 [Hyaloraphidium curvatum]|nr:hypothetical protein DFJ74DRAFT_732476 [Hyaloraphidium curvatum]